MNQVIYGLTFQHFWLISSLPNKLRRRLFYWYWKIYLYMYNWSIDDLHHDIAYGNWRLRTQNHGNQCYHNFKALKALSNHSKTLQTLKNILKYLYGELSPGLVFILQGCHCLTHYSWYGTGLEPLSLFDLKIVIPT